MWVPQLKFGARIPVLDAATQPRSILRAARPACATTAPVLRNFTFGRRGNKNQLYDPIRDLDRFDTVISLSTSARTPLITLWTASWGPSTSIIEQTLEDLLKSGVGEEEGSVGYATVAYDAPDIMMAGLGARYQITSIPTLLSFDAGKAQSKTREEDMEKLKRPEFLAAWIRTEARRQGRRGGA